MCYFVVMTKREIALTIEARNNLLRQRVELSKNDAQSASLSAGGGSQSYTSRSLKEIDDEIARLDRLIAEYKNALLGAGTLNLEYPRYC